MRTKQRQLLRLARLLNDLDHGLVQCHGRRKRTARPRTFSHPWRVFENPAECLDEGGVGECIYLREVQWVQWVQRVQWVLFIRFYQVLLGSLGSGWFDDALFAVAVLCARPQLKDTQ